MRKRRVPATGEGPERCDGAVSELTLRNAAPAERPFGFEADGWVGVNDICNGHTLGIIRQAPVKQQSLAFPPDQTILQESGWSAATRIYINDCRGQ